MESQNRHQVLVSAPTSWLQIYDASGESEDALRTGIRGVFSHGEARALRIINAIPGRDLLSFWSGIGQTLGSTMPIGSDGAVGVVRHGNNDWMDVRYDPQRQQTFRHASAAQPLHTDSAHVATVPGFALMVMAKQAQSGGETVLLDVETLAQAARADDPALFTEMTELPVNMALPPGTGSHEPILQKRGDRLSIRWNYYRVVPGQGDRVDAFRERSTRSSHGLHRQRTQRYFAWKRATRSCSTTVASYTGAAHSRPTPMAIG